MLEDTQVDYSLVGFSVKTCTQTCWACPSQWDIYTDDNRYVYVRFRWGHFTAYLDAFADKEQLLFEWHDEDEWQGFMDTQEMVERLSDVLDFSHAEFKQ